MSTSEEDQHLIECIRAGDPLAWEKCVQRFSGMVWRLLRGPFHLSIDDAEDAFQTIFLKLQECEFRRLRQWRGRAPLDAFMVVVVRRLACDYLRAIGRGRVSDGVENDSAATGPTPEEHVLWNERLQAVQTCRERLAERDRELLNLRYALELQYRAIGTRLGMTVSHVGVALGKAEARIRRCLQERYPDLFGRGEKNVQAAG